LWSSENFLHFFLLVQMIGCVEEGALLFPNSILARWKPENKSFQKGD